MNSFEVDDVIHLMIELGKLIEAKQWKDAESCAKIIIQHLPNDIYALKRLGKALVKQGKLEEAVIYYEKAVDVGKKFEAGHMEYVKQLDVLYRQLRRYEDAFLICSYYLDQNKNSLDAINRYNRSAKLIGRNDLVKKESSAATPRNNYVSLGKPLPPVAEIAVPTQEELDNLSEQWNKLVPEEWRGLLDPKPLGYTGTPAPQFYYDNMRGVTIRARNGQVVTTKEKRLALRAFQKARGAKD